MSEADIEDFLCVQVENVEFSQIKKTKDLKQEKKCQFLESRISFRVQDIVEKYDGDEISITIPSICVENISYEEDQGK